MHRTPVAPSPKHAAAASRDDPDHPTHHQKEAAPSPKKEPLKSQATILAETFGGVL